MTKTAARWRIPDALWARIEPLLPPGKPHPLGCHNRRVDNRRALDAIVFVLRTGCHWNALNATGICSSSSAHRRFQEWVAAGVFHQLWAQGLAAYDELHGIDWDWLAMDGAMTKAPLGGGETGPNPTDRGKQGTQRRLLTEGGGVPIGVVAAGANRNDFKLTQATLASIPIARPTPTPEQPQGLCLDKGYDYPEVYALVTEFGYTAHIPHPRTGRGGAGDQARGRLPSAALGRGTDTLLDEPLPPHPHPLGEEAGELSEPAPFRLRPHRLPRCWSTGIGSKGNKS